MHGSFIGPLDEVVALLASMTHLCFSYSKIDSNLGVAFLVTSSTPAFELTPWHRQSMELCAAWRPNLPPLKESGEYCRILTQHLRRLA